MHLSSSRARLRSAGDTTRISGGFPLAVQNRSSSLRILRSMTLILAILPDGVP